MKLTHLARNYMNIAVIHAIKEIGTPSMKYAGIQYEEDVLNLANSTYTKLVQDVHHEIHWTMLCLCTKKYLKRTFERAIEIMDVEVSLELPRAYDKCECYTDELDTFVVCKECAYNEATYGTRMETIYIPYNRRGQLFTHTYSLIHEAKRRAYVHLLTPKQQFLETVRLEEERY